MSAAEIKLSRLLEHLPEIQATIIQNRRLIIIPAAAVLGYFLLKDPLKDGLDKFFFNVYTNYLLDGINQSLLPFREEMKALLSKQQSADPQPHNDSTLRILEIGVGPGVNLDFFPKSSRVIAVEPNPYFIDALLEKQKKHPELSRIIRGFAEDLSDIQDESIDAVVSTLVLCSVKDLDKSLQEIKRVLVKGGRFYFFEHQACHVSNKRYITQVLLTPFWRTVFDGCQLDRKISDALERNGFQMTNVRKEVGSMYFVLNAHTMGYVTKN